MEENIKYLNRYIARVVIEAETPLFVGSGESSLLKDALVQRDIHGFPMIQGTSLTGVLKHALEDNSSECDDWKSFFGYHQAPKGKKGLGSQIKISSAYLIIKKNKVAEGLSLDEESKKLLPYFEDLPVRQHVRITDKGVAKEHGLFDNEVVYRGCRFVFEIELKGTGSEGEKKNWDALLTKLTSPVFRIGQGTRNGYGKLNVKSVKTKVFELKKKPDDFQLYLDFNPSLNYENVFLQEMKNKPGKDEELTHYKLELNPDTFFIFSAGYGDDEVDNKPITESVIVYDEKGSIINIEEQTLIPVSSIKGALSHRTAYHYNMITKVYADKVNPKDFEKNIGINNQAVYDLFGAEAGAKSREGKRGKVIIDDLFYSDINNDKIFNHVAIDRFTGGAINGALFSEKVSQKNGNIELDIYVENSENVDADSKEAFEEALKDVCKGLLPLGGMTNKGHGIFTGKLLKNNKEIYSYE